MSKFFSIHIQDGKGQTQVHWNTSSALKTKKRWLLSIWAKKKLQYSQRKGNSNKRDFEIKWRRKSDEILQKNNYNRKPWITKRAKEKMQKALNFIDNLAPSLIVYSSFNGNFSCNLLRCRTILTWEDACKEKEQRRQF